MSLEEEEEEDLFKKKKGGGLGGRLIQSKPVVVEEGSFKAKQWRQVL